MTILYVREKIIGREGSGDETGSQERKKVWLIGVDSLLHDTGSILKAPGLPVPYSIFVGTDGVPDFAVRLRKYTAVQTDDFQWEVTGHYTTRPLRGRTDQQEKANPDPTARPTEISVDGVTFTKPIDYTPDGAPICTSVGGRFDPAVERDDSRRTYTFVRNESQPSTLADVYKDVLNSDMWLGYPPGTAKCGLIKEQRADENGVPYWKETYPISIDLDGWDAKVIDQDTYWLKFTDNSNGDQKSFFDSHGNPLSGNQPLNGEGGPLYPQGFGGDIAPGATSKLSASIQPSDTSISVASVAGFPVNAGTYPIVLKIGTELLQATALSGTTFTVKRGYGGSAPGAWLANRVVQMQPYYLTFARYRRLPFKALNLPGNT